MKIINNGSLLENKKDYAVEENVLILKNGIKGEIEITYNYLPIVNRNNRRDKKFNKT